jgi:hypothetical protein
LAPKKQIRYRDAGVDIDEGDRAVASIKKLARQTFTRGVLTDIGSFGASYQLSGFRKPVLMSSADGVGAKLKENRDQTGKPGTGRFPHVTARAADTMIGLVRLQTLRTARSRSWRGVCRATPAAAGPNGELKLRPRGRPGTLMRAPQRPSSFS